MEDDHVDRPDVETQQCAQLTGTNRSNGLIALIINVQSIWTSDPGKTSNSKTNMCSFLCPSPAWWLWRGVHTRSHLELGRKSPQRQWYFVSRRGRVGRCQACKGQRNIPPSHDHLTKPPLANATGGFAFRALQSSSRKRLQPNKNLVLQRSPECDALMLA